jgi:hypothetical protein
MLQITAKTGGIPYYIAPESLPLRHTMVIGIAVSQTVVAVAASFDQTLARYQTTAFALDNPFPSERLTAFVSGSVANYAKRTASQPRRVVVFREGCGYGAMPAIKGQEVPALQAAIGNASLVYCVVQKRSLLKLMDRNADFANPPPGTVVGGRIAAAGLAEFYMISHEAREGTTASPTRYTILHHYPVSWHDDQFVQLAHYLTCQYPNWPGAIRVPCALMHASKLAEVCRLRLGGEFPNDCLSEFLHFL